MALRNPNPSLRQRVEDLVPMHGTQAAVAAVLNVRPMIINRILKKDGSISASNTALVEAALGRLADTAPADYGFLDLDKVETDRISQITSKVIQRVADAMARSAEALRHEGSGL